MYISRQHQTIHTDNENSLIHHFLLHRYKDGFYAFLMLLFGFWERNGRLPDYHASGWIVSLYYSILDETFWQTLYDPTLSSPKRYTFPLAGKSKQRRSQFYPHYQLPYLLSSRLYRFDVRPPFSRQRFSLETSPARYRSSNARFTVETDRLRSLAIVLMPGQHFPFLLALSRRYM